MARAARDYRSIRGSTTAVATAPIVLAARARAPRPAAGTEALRRRLARLGAGAPEQVTLDFLDDDLQQARLALAEVTTYLAAVERAVEDVRSGRRQLIDLAVRDGAPASIEQLHEAVTGLRRRLARTAVRLPPA